MFTGLFPILFCVIFDQLQIIQAKNGCNSKIIGDSVVCICDEAYCDYYDAVPPTDGEYLAVSSSKAGLRFKHHYGYLQPYKKKFEESCNDVIKGNKIVLNIKQDVTYQEILGFGGAFTDTAGYNIDKFSDEVKEHFFRSYFSRQGLRYNIGRVAIGHTDCSIEEYYLNDVIGDMNMTHFALPKPEIKYKIPFVKKAKNMSKDDFLITSSIWSPPKWMKTEDSSGALLRVQEKYYDAYAKYVVKFLQAYEEEGVTIWTVSAANEPIFNKVGPILINPNEDATAWPLNKLARFVVDHLGPVLRNTRLKTKILSYDENRYVLLPGWTDLYEGEAGIDEYMEYVGLHGYSDEFVSGKLIDRFHQSHPNSTIIMTEFCTHIFTGVILGSWSSFEEYVYVLMNGLRHWTSGFIDWNLTLDLDSGPTFTSAHMDALIIADTHKNRFYKQPSFYGFGHFSKFIPRGSRRIEVESIFSTDIQYIAVVTPENHIVVIVYNHYQTEIKAVLRDKKKGIITLRIGPKTICTILY